MRLPKHWMVAAAAGSQDLVVRNPDFSATHRDIHAPIVNGAGRFTTSAIFISNSGFWCRYPAIQARG